MRLDLRACGIEASRDECQDAIVLAPTPYSVSIPREQLASAGSQRAVKKLIIDALISLRTKLVYEIEESIKEVSRL